MHVHALADLGFMIGEFQQHDKHSFVSFSEKLSVVGDIARRGISVFACAGVKPGMQQFDFLTNKAVVAKCSGQGGHVLAAGQQMHGQFIGIPPATELPELSSQPDPEQREQSVGIRLSRTPDLSQFAAQRAYRAAVMFY